MVEAVGVESALHGEAFHDRDRHRVARASAAAAGALAARWRSRSLEGLAMQRVVDPDGFDHASAWRCWRDVVATFLGLPTTRGGAESTSQPSSTGGLRANRTEARGQQKVPLSPHPKAPPRQRSTSSYMYNPSAKPTSLPSLASLRGRHYFTDQEFTTEELVGLLDLAVSLKAVTGAGPLTPFLEGRSLGMIFEQPSTRTRISFEAGMTELGGHAQYLRPGEIHLGGHETVADTARVISSLVDAIMARTAYHTTLAELAAAATVPVINGLTDDYDHPVQSMTDALTIREHFGMVKASPAPSSASAPTRWAPRWRSP